MTPDTMGPTGQGGIPHDTTPDARRMQMEALRAMGIEGRAPATTCAARLKRARVIGIR